MYFRNFNEFDHFKCMYCPFSYFYRQGPPMPPPIGNQQSGPPMAPPPTTTPKKSKADAELKAVDPGAIRPCKYRYVYIWLKNGKSFWAWLTYVGKKSVAGWRWNGFYWVYFGVDLRKIESFVCY
ncbi:hypothetical protein [Clostridium ganghwense]|uniref:Transporter n=1 Tax=Clostridium ganghwense TaxID=312089 RepID=A0ABT4CS60_9CLOT|nr:hypothetical protein [Clostridium ganghwense]MCY6371903.1 hypothetical protein [Clostridium ganghwense]